MFHDIPQNNDAWLDMRAEKVTGSAVKDVMANYGKAFGEPAKKLAANIAVERLRGERIQGDRYTNVHMEAGHVEEPIARVLYEERTGNVVTNGGFYDNGKTGCSPDGGVLFEKGGVEIKSVVPHVQLAIDKRKSFDPKYKWQLVFNLRETGWDWIDYVSFCDQYYGKKRLLINRLYAKDCTEYFDMMSIRLKEFEELIEDNIKTIKTPW